VSGVITAGIIPFGLNPVFIFILILCELKQTEINNTNRAKGELGEDKSEIIY
jgi:hypothetical protein